MKLNWINAENVFSFEKVHINFENLGNIVKVEGKNLDSSPVRSNGSGKSSLIEIFSLLVRGKTIRKSTKKDIKNNYTNGKPVIKGKVNDNIIIERCISPPSLYVTVDGKPHNGESVAETQKMLFDLLNTNDRVFMASMVFGQENNVGFLTASPEDKRVILQSFLNANDLFKNRHSVKSLKSEYSTNKKVSQALYESTQSSILKVEENINELNSLKKESEDILSSKKKVFIEKYSLSEIQDKERFNHELDLEINTENMKLDHMVRDLESKKKLYIDTSGTACESCGALSSSKVDFCENLKIQIKELHTSIADKRKYIQKKVKELDSLAIPISSQDIEVVESIKDFESQIKFYKDRKKDLLKEKENYSNDVMQNEKMYSLMRFWEQAFSEKGLIRYIIRNILDYFNDRVNVYLGVITKGAFAMDFDELLQETILRNGNLAVFDMLSGGEKKSINLAVMLALNDLLLLSGKERSNIIFFDEVAESLDDEGVVGLFNLIKKQSSDKKLFVITHNETLSSLLVDEADTITMSKRFGITTVKV